jgi:two-component system response regulator NreC
VSLVKDQPDLLCCAEANAETVSAAVARENPDLVVLDGAIQDGGELDLINRLHTDFPRLRMLIVVEHEDVAFAERALQNGAKGCVPGSEPSHEILSAIRTVLNDKIFLSHNLSVGLLQRMLKPGGSHPRKANERLSL